MRRLRLESPARTFAVELLIHLMKSSQSEVVLLGSLAKSARRCCDAASLGTTLRYPRMKSPELISPLTRLPTSWLMSPKDSLWSQSCPGPALCAYGPRQAGRPL